jgi:hypothetical protein
MYEKINMHADLFQAMRSRPAKYTKRPLGNSYNIPMWTNKKIDELWEGIVTAWKLFFMKEFPQLQKFSRLVIAVCIHASTGDYSLNCSQVDLKDWTAQGFAQVTPASALKEYYLFGKPINSAIHGCYGKVLADPTKVREMDTSNPGLTVLMWAWYTKNCVVTGVSFVEYANRVQWNTPLNRVTPVVGNCLLTWVAGPHNDFLGAGARAFNDCYKRVLDYYTQSGFGSKYEFDAIMHIPLCKELVFVGVA